MKKEILTAGLAVLCIGIGLNGCFEKDVSGKAKGGFYVNDCGEPKGGWEYTANYFANFTLSRGGGKLILTVKPGLGDCLEKHEYSVILREYTSEEMTVLIGGREVVLEWVENDTVWDTWHNHYIASFGVNMPENEIIGRIRPKIFPGILGHYYVELRFPQIDRDS